MRYFHGFLMLTLFWLLSACSSSAGLKPGEVSNTGETSGLVLIKTWPASENRHVLFRGYDTESKRLISQGRNHQLLWHPVGYVLKSDGSLHRPDDEIKPRYHLFRFDAGDYVTTSLFDFSLSRKILFCFSDGTFVFSVVPGEILVLGAFNIDGPRSHGIPGRLFDVSISQDEAEKVLRAFGDIDARIRYYQLRSVTFEDRKTHSGSDVACGE